MRQFFDEAFGKLAEGFFFGGGMILAYIVARLLKFHL